MFDDVIILFHSLDAFSANAWSAWLCLTRPPQHPSEPDYNNTLHSKLDHGNQRECKVIITCDKIVS